MGLRIFFFTLCVPVFFVISSPAAVKGRPQSVWGCYSLLVAQSSGPMLQQGQFDPKIDAQMDQVHHNIQMGQFDLVIGQMEGRAAHDWLIQLIERELSRNSSAQTDELLVIQIIQQMVLADLPSMELAHLTEVQKGQLTFWLAVFRALPPTMVATLLKRISDFESKSLSGPSIQNQSTWLYLLRLAQ